MALACVFATKVALVTIAASKSARQLKAPRLTALEMVFACRMISPCTVFAVAFLVMLAHLVPMSCAMTLATVTESA